MTSVEAECDVEDDRIQLPRCADFDEDCDEVECKVHCWLYDPARGFCPWLIATESDAEA